MVVLCRQLLCYGQHIVIMKQNSDLLLILVECINILIPWGWPYNMLIQEKIEDFVTIYGFVT